jgi:hypothetical protein
MIHFRIILIFLLIYLLLIYLIHFLVLANNLFFHIFVFLYFSIQWFSKFGALSILILDSFFNLMFWSVWASSLRTNHIIVFLNFFILTIFELKSILSIFLFINIMINENRGRYSRLIWNFRLLVKHFFPSICSLQRLRVGSVGHNNASINMPGIKRLECSLRIHIRALVPQLNSYFLAVNIQYLETEVSCHSLFLFNSVLRFLCIYIESFPNLFTGESVRRQMLSRIRVILFVRLIWFCI